MVAPDNQVQMANLAVLVVMLLIAHAHLELVPLNPEVVVVVVSKPVVILEVKVVVQL